MNSQLPPLGATTLNPPTRNTSKTRLRLIADQTKPDTQDKPDTNPPYGNDKHSKIKYDTGLSNCIPLDAPVIIA